MDKIFRLLGGDNKLWRFAKYSNTSIGKGKPRLEDHQDVDNEPFFMNAPDYPKCFIVSFAILNSYRMDITVRTLPY